MNETKIYSGTICRGCYHLGTACGKCEKCKDELEKNKPLSSKYPYRATEEKIMNCLAEAFNLFKELEETHPSHNQDFQDGVHRCQDVVIHRIVQRDYPTEFPTYKEEAK